MSQLFKMKPLKMKQLLLAVAGSILLLSGCSLLPKEDKPLDPPLVAPAKVNVETYEVKLGDIAKQVKGGGVFEATKMDHHFFKQSGSLVQSVLVQSGDLVKKGQLLVQLELKGLDIEVKQTELNMLRAQIGKDNAPKDQTSQRIAQLEYEIASMRYNTAKLQYDNQQLRAEMDGLVVFVESLKEGDPVNAYQELVTIADPTQMRIAMEGNSTELSNIEVGMKAELSMDGEDYIGTVVQSPKSSPVVANPQLAERYNKTVYIKPDKEIPGMKFGAALDVALTIQKKTNVVKIPKRGFRSYLGNSYVQIIDGDSRREVDVEKGIESATEVEIVNGLKEGQSIILQ